MYNLSHVKKKIFTVSKSHFSFIHEYPIDKLKITPRLEFTKRGVIVLLSLLLSFIMPYTAIIDDGNIRGHAIRNLAGNLLFFY